MTIAMGGAAVVAVSAALGHLARESFWQAAAIGGIAIVPHGGRAAVRPLYMIAAVAALGVLATAPNDGGAQWGPRYLLVATPAVLLLAAETATMAFRMRQALTVALAITVTIASLVVTRRAYRELRASKQEYAQLVDSLDAGRRGAGTILTDLWWIDQIAAPLGTDVTFLFVSSAERAGDLGRRLEARGIHDFVLVRSTTESRVFAPGTPHLPGSCYAFERVASLPLRGVEIHVPRCIAANGLN
jgi:hypothetical protein